MIASCGCSTDTEAMWDFSELTQTSLLKITGQRDLAQPWNYIDMTASATSNNKARPKFLNLLQIRLPVTGLVSIGHRVSGVFLFISSPVALYLLDRSMRSSEEFDQLRLLFSGLPVKLGLLLLVIAVGYHLIAGIRFLLIDFGVGEELAGARRGAWSVIALSIFVLLAALVVML